MGNETESPAPKTPLRWYQYRLRTLLIIMTVLAAWLSVMSHRARQQKLAIETIRKLGGSVKFDYQKKPGQYFYYNIDAAPSGPTWFRNFFGEDYFQNVTYVDFDRMPITDDELVILENLPDLEFLSLAETPITGNGLVHIKGLKKLVYLDLSDTSVDDSGLAYLKNLTHLRGLTLKGTNITDAGTIHLQDLENLEEWLCLGHTCITNDSLKYFKKFKKLQTLNLTYTRITREAAVGLYKDLPKTKIYSGNFPAHY